MHGPVDHSSCQQVKNDKDRSQVKVGVCGQHGRQGVEIQKGRALGECFTRDDDVVAVVEDRARRETGAKVSKKSPLILNPAGRPWEISARLVEGR